MKKTLNLSIGGGLFHVEEDAFEKLESYTNSIREHFAGNVDKEEILQDIEGRIAEKFSENTNKIITLKDVESVIETMGTVEQFDGDENQDSSEGASKTVKKLYRDPDNTIIAGVSSGLGHFFGIDAIVFRLIFAVSIFAGGAGVIAYIILWILVPEAKTPSQKLSMRGNAVTISAMADMIKEKIEEVKTPENTNLVRRTISIPIDIIRAVVQFIGRVIFPSVRVLLGSVITIGSFLFAIGATIFTSMTLFSLTPRLIEGPLLGIAQSGMAQVLIIALYILVFIPLLFALFLGISLVTKHNPLSKIAISSLLGIWFIAVAVAPAVGSVVAMRATEIIESDPYYKVQSQVLEVGTFNTVVVTDSRYVRFVEGTTYQVEVKGRTQALAEVTVVNENGTLTFGRKENEDNQPCIFCDGGHAEIIITTAGISSITLKDSSHVSGDISGAALALILDDSSSVNLDVDVPSLEVTVEDSSRAELSGKTKSLMANVQNSSRLKAEELEVNKATVKVINSSSADIYVTETLNVTVGNASHVFYTGQPTVEEKVDGSSRLRSPDTVDENSY